VTAATLAKARLVQIKWDANQTKPEDVSGGKAVTVQFNPQTLRISYANQNAGGDQPGRKVTQFVGSGTSKLAVELLFDTSESGEDVRKRVEEVAFFIQAKEPKKKRVPPGIRFEWGSFIFRGIVDGLQETLDYFSESGVPLRATVALGISRQDIEFEYGKPLAGEEGGPPGAGPAQPLEPARANDSVQSLAGRAGRSSDWKSIAAANGIEDPLRLSPGSLVDLGRPGGS
jgi:hypothetical protein